VGGGDFATGADRGYAAIVSKSAIERALAGGPTVDRASSVTMVQRLDPDPYDNFGLSIELLLANCKRLLSLSVNVFSLNIY